jgi:hypothetical protein
MKKLVLFPLLALLVTAPICTRAHADPWFTLGLGWWIVPIAAGGVALYEVGRNQASNQNAYVPQQTVYIKPTPVYYPQEYEQPTYYQQQYGYVVQSHLPQ